MPRILPGYLLSILAIAAHADVQAPADIEQIVVTGVYISQADTNLTGKVYSIVREAIEAGSHLSTASLLSGKSGLLVNQQGGSLAGISELSIRGGEPNFTNAYINGIRVNDPLNNRGGSFDFNGLTPDAIDRIEIFKGPISTVHRSGALSGVINVLVAQPTEKKSQTLGVHFSESNYYRTYYNASGTLDKLGYGIFIGKIDDGQSYYTDSFDQNSSYTTLSYKLSPRHTIGWNLHYRNTNRKALPEKGGGPRLSVSDDLESSTATEKASRLSWQGQLHNKWQSTLDATWLSRNQTTLSPGIIPYQMVPPTTDDSSYRDISWRWANRITHSDDFWIDAGIDGNSENGSSDGNVDFGFLIPTDYDLDRDTHGVFLSVNWRNQQDWLLHISRRLDEFEQGNSEQTSRVGLRSPVLINSLVISANWGSAFKLPSFIALAHPLVGNPNLLPEESSGWEINFDWQINEDTNAVLALFDNSYRDLIDFDSDLFRNVNRNQVDTSGFDLELTWQLSQSARFSGDITYTDIDLPSSESELTGRPQWSASASFHQNFPNRVELMLNGRWSDKRIATSLHNGFTESEELDGVLIIDVNLTWQASNAWTLSAGIENLFDRSYSEAIGFPGVERRAIGSVRWRF